MSSVVMHACEVVFPRVDVFITSTFHLNMFESAAEENAPQMETTVHWTLNLC